MEYLAFLTLEQLNLQVNNFDEEILVSYASDMKNFHPGSSHHVDCKKINPLGRKLLNAKLKDVVFFMLENPDNECCAAKFFKTEEDFEAFKQLVTLNFLASTFIGWFDLTLSKLDSFDEEIFAMELITQNMYLRAKLQEISAMKRKELVTWLNSPESFEFLYSKSALFDVATKDFIDKDGKLTARKWDSNIFYLSEALEFDGTLETALTLVPNKDEILVKDFEESLKTLKEDNKKIVCLRNFKIVSENQPKRKANPFVGRLKDLMNLHTVGNVMVLPAGMKPFAKNANLVFITLEETDTTEIIEIASRLINDGNTNMSEALKIARAV